MAVPTKPECKLNLSFDMVAKTMTATVQSTIASQGVDGLTYTIAYGTILDPLGNSVDIDEIFYDGDAGVAFQTFDAPLDSDGNVLNGAYSILLPYVTVSDGTPTTYTNVDSNYTLSYAQPTVVLTAVIDCISPSFVSTDATDYRVIDPTSQGYITPTTVSYAHNLYYPVTSNGYPDNTTETSDLIITRGAYQFYQGTQTATVSHAVSYTFVDLLVVTDTIADDLETKVDCSTLLCGIMCGLNKLYKTMQSYRLSNKTRYLQTKELYDSLCAEATNAQGNINCGNSEEATAQINNIKSQLGDCCGDCKTKDGDLICGAANPVFPFTPENVANKSTDGTFAANSDILYPSQKAAKTYADTKEPLIGFTPENVANKSTSIFLGTSNTLYPTQNAVKSYVDNKVPYLSIVALMSQSGTDNPTWAVLQDEFEANYTLTRDGAGAYIITADSAIFTSDKTVVFFNLNYQNVKVATASWLSTSSIEVVANDYAGTPVDTFTDASIEIRVYA